MCVCGGGGVRRGIRGVTGEERARIGAVGNVCGNRQDGAGAGCCVGAARASRPGVSGGPGVPALQSGPARTG